MTRLFAPVLLGLALALGASAACQDDSVYRSGDIPPSPVDGGGTDDGLGGAAGDSDGGSG